MDLWLSAMETIIVGAVLFVAGYALGAYATLRIAKANIERIGAACKENIERLGKAYNESVRSLADAIKKSATEDGEKKCQ